jgi:hypothetical protein
MQSIVSKEAMKLGFAVTTIPQALVAFVDLAI